MTEDEDHFCRVCGRTPEELRDINQNPEFETHQGVMKCRKCICEYETVLKSQRQISDNGQEECDTTRDWKQAIRA